MKGGWDPFIKTAAWNTKSDGFEYTGTSSGPWTRHSPIFTFIVGIEMTFPRLPGSRPTTNANDCIAI